MKTNLLVIGMILGSSLSQAKEGFSREKDLLPQAVQKAWDSVVMLAPNPATTSHGYSTAVVMKKTNLDQDKVAVQILTAAYSIPDECKNAPVVCPTKSILFDYGADFSGEGFHGIFPETAEAKRFEGVKILKVDAVFDLALIEITAEAKNVAKLEPVEYQSDCASFEKGQKLYAIGYPAIYRRPGNNDADRFLFVKRWSSGYDVLGETPISTGEGVPKGMGLVTTIDAMPGNTGSPLINEKGFLIGNLLASSLTYAGNENTNPMVATSITNACSNLSTFLKGF